MDTSIKDHSIQGYEDSYFRCYLTFPANTCGTKLLKVDDSMCKAFIAITERLENWQVTGCIVQEMQITSNVHSLEKHWIWQTALSVSKPISFSYVEENVIDLLIDWIHK